MTRLTTTDSRYNRDKSDNLRKDDYLDWACVSIWVSIGYVS